MTDSGGDPVAKALVDALIEATELPWAVLLFGSRLAGTAPSPHSAYDLVVLVDAYGPFYRRLHASGRHGRSPALLTALAGFLAPNVVSFDPGLPGGQIAKAMVLTPPDFARALSPGARDHFLVGRLIQTTEVLQARDAGVRARVEALLEGARKDVLRWAGPWLPERFGASDLARRALEVSYRGEIRPESGGRAAAVYEAQRDALDAAFREVLERAEEEGAVVRAHGPGEDRWRLVARPGLAERARLRLYFAFSKARATTRWIKHVVTFDDWLAYIQKKVERRTGMRVEVTPMERRLPFLLLWPKVFGVLRELRRTRRA